MSSCQPSGREAARIIAGMLLQFADLAREIESTLAEHGGMPVTRALDAAADDVLAAPLSLPS